MELIMQEQSLRYLSRVLCETIPLEQTADVVIPDSYPDAERVVEGFGNVLIRNAECVGTSVSIVGNVQAGVLFVTQEGEVHSLQTQIPFSLRKELPQGQEDCKLQCNCTVQSVDARLLNSRKLLLRATLSCTLCVYQSVERQIYDVPQPSEKLQIKRMELPLRMPLSLGEKSFSINEELELPSSKPAIARVMKTLARTQLLEQKAVGNKAVFKGELCVHVLYADREEKLHSQDWQLPFSQYAELECDVEDAELQITLSLTGFEAEQDGQAECTRLFLSAGLLAQCTAIGEQKLCWIDDAFCTDVELNPQYDRWEISGLLDMQSMRETLNADIEENAASVVDAWVYPSEPIKQRTPDGYELRLPLCCNLLYYDTNGALHSRVLRPSAELRVPLHENGACRVDAVDFGEISAHANGHTLEMRVPMQARVECYALHPIRALCGGEMNELAQEKGRSPSVILRRTEEQEELWEIAKACRTSVQAIEQANALDSTSVPANTMLLIPM